MQEYLSFDNHDMAETLAVSTREFEALRAHKKSISTHSLLELSRKLNVHVAKIYTGDIDLEILQKRLRGDLESIPTKYLQDAYSKTRTSINILDFLDDHFGRHYKQGAIEYFQMSDAIFGNPNREISLLFLSELCEYLAKYRGMTDEMFYQMGQFSYFSNKDTELGKILSQCKNKFDVFDLAQNQLSHMYDKNFRYEYSQISSSFSVTKAFALHPNCTGNKWTAIAKAGVISSLPLYCEEPSVKVEVVKSIAQNDKYCEYHIFY
jgi:hypothetical protein